MAIRGITFAKQTVTSNDDAHINQILLAGQKGRTRGCKMTFGKDDIYISEGYFFAANRLIQIPSPETVSTPVITAGTTYCRLVFEVDMNKVNTNLEFNQGYFKILTSNLNYPDIVQEDLMNGGNVYQLPFAKFVKTINGIASFVEELETIGIPPATNSIIYVSTSGSDAAGDGTESAPFATIQHAIDAAPKNLMNREITINVASGTYSENVEVAGFYGGTLRFDLGDVIIKSFVLYETNVIINGTSLTLNASGNVYGFRCHRGANAIFQCALTVNGSTNGIFVSYGSRFSCRLVTINSCTNAVVCNFAAQLYIGTLSGSKNNNGVSVAGGIATFESIVSSMASTLYISTAGGRIFTGSQASF